MKKKCVFVMGPESTGSMFISKIVSHALGIDKYGEWNGRRWNDKGEHKVFHMSLPSQWPPHYPNIEQLIAENQESYDIYFILPTRDITISERSRITRWVKSVAQVEQESMKAKEIMIHIMQSGQKYFIWSYETFMYLGQAYLDQLYKFLAIDSDFCPDLEDANRNRITKGKLKAKPRVLFRWRMIRKRIRSFFMRNIGVREEGPSIL